MNKKDSVLSKKAISWKFCITTAILISVVTFLILFPFSGGNSPKTNAANTTKGRYIKAVADDDKLFFPLKEFTDEARYYEYDFENKSVRFFLLKSNDGTIRAAFDACDVCFRAKKGYSQRGDYMQCNNCGQVFPEDRINVELGGCNPSPLNREIEGDYLIIRLDDVAKGRRFF